MTSTHHIGQESSDRRSLRASRESFLSGRGCSDENHQLARRDLVAQQANKSSLGMVLNGALWKKVSIARGKEAVVLMESGRKRLSSDGRKKDAVTGKTC